MKLSDPIFTDPDDARAYLEAQRWPHGVTCPHCGGTEKCTKMEGAKHRPGLYQCGDCRKQFTVTVGTVFERSKVPLNKWLLAAHLMASSKKGISAHQLHRSIGVTYKTAWFMFHRIREAMRSDDDVSMFGGGGGVVEVDETFIGRDKSKKPLGMKKGRGHHHKYKILSLVDRSTGKVKSVVVDDLKQTTLLPILRENIAKEAVVYTDEAKQYVNLKRDFATHDFTTHGRGEYVRGGVHTNTIEGYFSIFKRGMKGTYQHCGRQHLHRYAAEFEFRYNNRTAHHVTDTERAALILKGAEGKRLTYRRPDPRPSA
ncbi:IS1595 family transposase [Pikeienuella sp. HZG-20]|uniref:IS1595 family transposase n=1 Tax=Paludibacillus litoralis TaxID=3133267 RepID=UPI0030EF37CB